MPVHNLRSDWVSGNLVFKETLAGNGGAIHFGIDDYGIDVKFFGATSGAYMLWDASADALVMDKMDLHLGDTDFLMFGDATSGDVSINWTGSVLAILPAAADTGAINIGNGTTDIDLKIFLGSATEFVDFNVGDSSVYFGGDGKGVDLKLFGETAGAYAMWDQSADALLLTNADLTSTKSTAATSGTVTSLTVGQTHTGVGANAEVIKATLTSNVALGSWGNALMGKVDLSTTGLVSGLIGCVCAELNMPGGTVAGGAGTYSCFEAEINCPTSYDSTVPIHVFQINAWGDEVAKFDSYGYLFDLTGVSSGASNLWYDNQKAAPAVEEFVRVKTPSGVRYLALYDANA